VTSRFTVQWNPAHGNCLHCKKGTWNVESILPIAGGVWYNGASSEAESRVMNHSDSRTKSLVEQLGCLDPRQVAAWRQMSPGERLDIAFQAYQFALDTVRLTERQRHPDMPPDELAWRVTRRMQGDPKLGR